MDKLVKIWNIMDEETEGEKGRKRDISLATSRDLGLVSVLSHFLLEREREISDSARLCRSRPSPSPLRANTNNQGKIFTTRFSPDPETPLTLAAGSKATVQIWDVASNLGARKAFGDRLRKYGRELGEMKKGGGVIGIEDVDEEED
jgi:periodic tryptophan protein 1